MVNNNAALLVIDLQVGPVYGTHNQEGILTVIKEVIKKAEDEDVPIFYIQHEEEKGGFLERGSIYWQFAEGISPRKNDVIINKKYANSFYKTSLKQELDDKGITDVTIVGVRTEFCVDSTCRGAVSLGFNVILVADGHTTADGVISAESIIKHHNHTLATIGAPDKSVNVLLEKEIRFS